MLLCSVSSVYHFKHVITSAKKAIRWSPIQLDWTQRYGMMSGGMKCLPKQEVSQNYTNHRNYRERAGVMWWWKSSEEGTTFPGSYLDTLLFPPRLPSPVSFLSLKSLLSASEESKCPKPLSKSPCVCLSPF